MPQASILVGDDTFNSDMFFIKLLPKDYSLEIRWKLISKDFKDSGVLQITVVPNINFEYKDILVEDPYLVGITEGEIEDVLIDKNDD